jgi:16S rRNA (uracil1498-N3)-methyltransferase
VTVHRFHVPEAAPGARLTLPEHSAHHAREVLRLRPGAVVRVFDGGGAEFEALLDSVTRKEVTARVTAAVPARAESPLFVSLAVAALKGDRMELVIQKATELGVGELRPVITARTDAAARPALQGSRQDRWDKVASGAAEQCGRAVVPRVAPTAMLDALAAEPFAGLRLVLAPEATDSPFGAAGDVAAVQALVGPAGGWEDRELARLREAGFTPVRLGPRILRAETAAVAAVALAQALWGDLR